MKKNKIISKLLVLILIVGFITFISNDTFAAINVEYYNAVVGNMEVNDANLDSKVSNSVLLDLLARLVYAIGSLLEWMLGMVFKLLTGQNMFPWADAILFNAVPFLDINIFNPSGASFVALLQDLMQRAYYTIFSLALTFFGIVVMITAIKLAITAVAEDKAKYKKAIVDWVLGLVMLVGIHYFISFALYLNEQLVIEASKFAQESMKDQNFMQQLYVQNIDNSTIVHNFTQAMLGSHWDWLDAVVVILIAAVAIAATVLFIVASLYTGGTVAIAVGTMIKVTVATSVIMAAGATTLGIMAGTATSGALLSAYRAALISDMTTEQAGNLIQSDDSVELAASLLKNDTYVSWLKYMVGKELEGDGKSFYIADSNSPETVKRLAMDVAQIQQAFKTGEYQFKMCPEDDKNCSDVNAYNYNVDEKRLYSYKEYLEGLVATYEQYKADAYKIIKDQNAQAYDMNRDGQTDYLYVRVMVSDSTFGKGAWQCYAPTGDGPINETSECIDLNDGSVPDDKMLVVYDELEYMHASALLTIYKEYTGLSNLSDRSLITNLAKIFKAMAWTYSGTSWQATQPVIENAIMYAILVVQSLIFFISYTKRLFYVIILILIAPIIVVYDFFVKFGK